MRLNLKCIKPHMTVLQQICTPGDEGTCKSVIILVTLYYYGKVMLLHNTYFSNSDLYFFVVLESFWDNPLRYSQESFPAFNRVTLFSELINLTQRTQCTASLSSIFSMLLDCFISTLLKLRFCYQSLLFKTVLFQK